MTTQPARTVFSAPENMALDEFWRHIELCHSKVHQYFSQQSLYQSPEALLKAHLLDHHYNPRSHVHRQKESQ